MDVPRNGSGEVADFAIFPSISQPMIIPVILCGGSGTRLWPLSRKSFPKQFVSLIDDKSLLQLALERVRDLHSQVITVAAEDHRFLVIDALQRAGVTGPILLEPAGRNTAPAMGLAAQYALRELPADAVLLFCPADHHIPDRETFVTAVQHGVPAAQAGAVVTFGVPPASPATTYGYIVPGPQRDAHSFTVEQFVEKPDPTRAQELMLKDTVFWNTGIFLARADTLHRALARHANDILISVETAMEAMQRETLSNGFEFIRPDPTAFTACRSQSIDYTVMEHHDDVAVVPFSGRWSDVGSWQTVADMMPPDAARNRLDGKGIVHRAENTFIHAQHRPVVAVGTRDLMIVDTPGAVLVVHSDEVGEMKALAPKLEAFQNGRGAMHRRIPRPWGWMDTLDTGDGFQVKRIGVKPDGALSLQKHRHRAEHWVSVKGVAEVTRGEDTFLLHENQSTYIPAGITHRLRNIGTTELVIIEVQTGDYLGEDDIQRLEDIYGRATRNDSEQRG